MLPREQDVLEKGTKAFISFVRAYKEHQCRFIFRRAAICSLPAVEIGGGGGGSSYGSAPTRTIDQNYEAGKNIFTGRSDTYGKLKFCVLNQETSEKVAVKSRTLKSFKRTNAADFANSLYHCDNPDQPITATLANADMNLVLYYLNKRYKLKLEN